MQSLSSVTQLLEAYFHEDWPVDDPDWQSVVRRFLASEPPSSAVALTRDLEQLLRLPDAELIQFVQYPRGNFDPSTDGLSYREWLEQMLALVSDAG